MDTDANNRDLLLLNALVDGELGPQDRAALAARLAVERDLARAYATLARLKATIGESASDAPAFVLPPAKRPARGRMIACAAAIVAFFGVGLVIAWDLRPAQDQAAAVAEPTAITLASLPAGATLPRLDTAGLKLIGLAIDAGTGPVLAASYRGPHGCRLELRAWASGAEAPPASAGAQSRRWQAGGLTYELMAHGMPDWRFAIIASAAEDQTRTGSDHDRIDRRLREASIGAPPCLG
jgi:anti-sigma factor RsiW